MNDPWTRVDAVDTAAVGARLLVAGLPDGGEGLVLTEDEDRHEAYREVLGDHLDQLDGSIKRGGNWDLHLWNGARILFRSALGPNGVGIMGVHPHVFIIDTANPNAIVTRRLRNEAPEILRHGHGRPVIWLLVRPSDDVGRCSGCKARTTAYCGLCADQ